MFNSKFFFVTFIYFFLFSDGLEKLRRAKEKTTSEHHERSETTSDQRPKKNCDIVQTERIMETHQY